jgi:VanZ family protein
VSRVYNPWIPVAVWSVAIVALSFLPPSSLPRFELAGLDRALHAVFYAVLAALVIRALATYDAGEPAIAAGALVGTLTFGGLMEWIQGFVGRTPDLIDWAADGAGTLVVLALRAGWTQLGRRRR